MTGGHYITDLDAEAYAWNPPVLEDAEIESAKVVAANILREHVAFTADEKREIIRAWFRRSFFRPLPIEDVHVALGPEAIAEALDAFFAGEPAECVDFDPSACETRTFEIDDMPRGGYRAGAGRKSAFPGKVIEAPVYMDFTPEGHRQLRRIVQRTGLSRNDVIGHLAIKYADELNFEDDGVVFAGKRAKNVMAIRLDQNGLAKLKAAGERTGKSASDIGEALVRIFGPAEKTFPVLRGSETKPSKRRLKRG